MRALLGLRRHHYTGRLGICLIVLALVAGVAGCGPVQYTLSISSTQGGTVTIPGEATFTYDAGTVVHLRAEAEEGYQFLYWTGNVGTIVDINAASTTVTMRRDYSPIANFASLFAGGNGTAADPFQIANWHHLHNIRSYPEHCFALKTDLHSGTTGYAALAGPTANEGKGWQPIGTWDGQFSGTLDGQRYEIRDLFIDRADEDGVGLFGGVEEGGVIENVRVVNVTVTGRLAVGGLVGVNGHESTVSNSYAAGSVAGEWAVGGLVGWYGYDSTVSNSYAAGSVAGDFGVGGLVGGNEGLVSNSYAAGSVTGDRSVGGLVGMNSDGTVSNSYAAGSVTGSEDVGGLVGWNNGAVSNCYSTGSVIGEDHVGGLVGQTIHYATVSNSFWDAQTSGTEESDGGTGKTTAGMMDIATFTDTETEGLDEPWDMIAVAPGETDEAYTWNIVGGVTYPFLGWESVV